MTEKLRIGVFMWFNKEIKDYAEINYRINKIYCDKYEYSLIKCDKRRCPNRKPHWERLPLLLEYFDSFDYLIWIDADAHFYIDSPPIKNVIDQYPEKLLILSGDSDVGNDKLTCQINSGFFIVKNTEQSRTILERWLKDESLFKSPKFSKLIFGANNWNDQAGLRLMYSENILDLKDNSVIIDYGILQHFNKSLRVKEPIYGLTDKPFLFHCTNGNNMFFENRVKYSKEYYSNMFLNKFNDFINPKIQMDKIVMNDIIMNCENKKMLVFGLGYDSELWYNCTNKNTVFIENNQTYIDLCKNIPNNNIIYYRYPADVTVKNSFRLKDETICNYKIPDNILEQGPFDIIIVDGPAGYDDTCPGRLLPIFWSKTILSKPGTIIYIDDASRPLETYGINKYFMNNTKSYFKNRLGTMKIYI